MSSPISHWSSSPDSQKSTAGDVLTPSRRVKALLAQFDDSESDQDITRPEPKRTVPEARAEPPAAEKLPSTNREEQDDEDEEDALLPAPRGRLAARLQAARSDRSSVSGDEEGGKAYERVKEQMLQGKRTTVPPNQAQVQSASDESEDELSGPAPRRILLKRKSSPVTLPAQTSTRSRSASPLFFSSPPATRKSPVSNHPSHQSDSDELPEKPAASGSSKFLALVEKHRKQRLAKEAAEVAKKAARGKQLKGQSSRAQGPRGSSPGDGSSEDTDMSDGGSAKKLTQSARPERNASKKAEEENKRVIQRMSRNRQLAHQARTRKKITKESLLAKFNFPLSGTNSFSHVKDGSTKSATASSEPTSEVEGAREHVTPPTSPLVEDVADKSTTMELPTAMELDHSVYNMADQELPLLEDMMMQPLPKVDKGKGRAVETSLGPDEPLRREIRPIRVKWSKRDTVMARAADSDSDLEIITSQSRTRKYAAFESLPKRKAKETESHLALRSLAHLMGNDNKQRSSMNTAEMEISLRKAAREQARREREEKIEELKARGVVIQTAEERERDQQEVEDIVEQARQEAAEIQKREKALAKKDGTFVKDALEDDSDDEADGDFVDEQEGAELAEDSGIDGAEEDEVEADEEDEEEEEGAILEDDGDNLIDQEADEEDSEEVSEEEDEEVLSDASDEEGEHHALTPAIRKSRNARVLLSDDEDDQQRDETSPTLPGPAKTPQSLPKSARKIIPGLHMSDDLPMGLTQAFAATMADSQTQDDAPATQEQDSLDLIRDLPSPVLAFAPKLNRLDSVDMVSDSQPASQTQPMNIDLSFSQSQWVPQSPVIGLGITAPHFTPSQLPFEPTQDTGYVFSPYAGSRFGAETPQQNAPHSTVETVILPNEADGSPILQRKGRLRRGRAADVEGEDVFEQADGGKSAFEVMKRAAKNKVTESSFDKSKSAAKDIIDEAAEESEDEYAGLGGASDDSAGEEDEDDRRMIDEDTQVGRGDEAKLAGLFADRERKQDEAAVSKLLKDITTGALRRKRGVGDDLDLSDEEDAAARRREAKRREFAKMRRELLKDEAVGKIAEDQKKEAFLRSIEDHDEVDEDDDDFDGQETPAEDESQSQSQQVSSEETQDSTVLESQNDPQAGQKRKRPLDPATDSTLNHLPPGLRRTAAMPANKRPTTLAEIRESVSFLIDEPDSQADAVDLGLSDSDDEPEAYVDLDRHLNAADENDDAEDLGDFIVDDDGQADIFKKPELPRRNSERASFSERRTKQRANVVDRLQLLRQASSSSSSSTSSHTAGSAKMAFLTNKAASTENLFGKVPALLRRATTNSSFGSMAGRGEEVSATGVVTTAGHGTERGGVQREKEFVRKGSGGRRNAVNYSVGKTAVGREKPGEKMRRIGKGGKGSGKRKSGGGFLGGLFRGNSWD